MLLCGDPKLVDVLVEGEEINGIGHSISKKSARKRSMAKKEGKGIK